VYEKLLSKIDKKNALISVIGLGYVGLPLAVELANTGFKVLGLEVDPAKAAGVNKSKSYIGDITNEELSAVVKKGRLSASTDFKKLSASDVIIICVPTPLRKSKDPDVSYIIAAAKSVKQTLKKGQLVILESTTYPGTTRELVQPMLEETGLKCGKDFFLAFSPERIDPANKKFTVKNMPKVIGGITEKCTKLGEAVYGSFTKVHAVSSADTAEMTKLLENTFRAVNIALVNEVAFMCDKLKINVWEVIDAAATKPFGFMPFYPGPGIGGHCIPLDPHYLSWKLKTLNFYARFVELASEINSKMPEYVVSKTIDALNNLNKSAKGAKILIVGAAYKKDVDDVRESPALDIISLLNEKGAKVFYFDPYVKTITTCCQKMSSVKSLADVKNYDVVVIVTNHTNIDYAKILKDAKAIVDSRNAYKGATSKKVIRI
jgi:UDP-N-acetyl-D-glucosamine dehydrogenase